MSLTDLPFELLAQIATEVANHHPADLANLALVNRHCFAVCKPLTDSLPYREIQIRMRAGWAAAKTSLAVRELTKRLIDTNSMSHVRRLRIDSDEVRYNSWEGDRHEDWKAPRLTDLKPKKPGESHDGMPDIFEYIRAPQNVYPRLAEPNVNLELFHPSKRCLKAPVRLLQQMATWDLISKLVIQLRHLEDVFVLALDPPPPQFLEMLEKKKPRCRLNLHGLIMFDQPAGGFPVSCLYDRQLLASPLLHSVVITDDGCNDGVDYDDLSNEPADISRFPVGAEMVQALREAPNLSHVYISRTRNHQERSFDILRNLGRWRQPGLALRELHFDDTWEIRTQTLYEWEGRFDFSRVEVLRLHKPLDDDRDEYSSFLRYFYPLLYANKSFRSLKVLELQLDCTDRLDRIDEYFCSLISKCIESLSPLWELTLEGWGKMIPLEDILHTHGSALRKLSLKNDGRSHAVYCLSESDITLIASNCPLLEELSCKVHRSEGDNVEVAIYRALGKISRLKYLLLYLTASYCHWNDRTYGSFMNARSHLPIRAPGLCEQHWTAEDDCEICHGCRMTVPNKFNCPGSPENPHKCRNGDIRQFMIDSSLDKDLACAIFRELATSKPEGSPRLEVMTIRVEGLEICDFDKTCIFPIVWRVESRLGFGPSIEVTAFETECTEGILALRKKPLCSEWEEAFKSIWPDDSAKVDTHHGGTSESGASDSESSELSSSSQASASGDSDWWMKWSSFPLRVASE